MAENKVNLVHSFSYVRPALSWRFSTGASAQGARRTCGFRPLQRVRAKLYRLVDSTSDFPALVVQTPSFWSSSGVVVLRAMRAAVPFVQ